MVQLKSVRESNALIKSDLPHGLVAVFTGATSGIGEAALKQFVRDAVKPRCYMVARSKTAADRIINECRDLNSEADLIFIQADLTLIKSVDEVCEQIKQKETKLNLLFLSAGAALVSRNKTSEGIHDLVAISVYARARFTQQLLPLLNKAQHLSRVVNIAAGAKEGQPHADDWQGMNMARHELRGHLGTMISLSHQEFALRAPNVSFIQIFPGLVNTPIFGKIPGLTGVLARTVVNVVSWWLAVPIRESGERNIFVSTSGSYPPRDKGANGVSLVNGLKVARGTDGVEGSGVYSLAWDGEAAPESIEKLLEEYTKYGMQTKLWEHFEAEFKRITGHS